MGEMKHTPGPWSQFVSYTGCEDTFEVGPGEFETVAYVRLGADDVLGDCEANARLIAAAPDMLEALESAEEIIVALIGMHGDGGAGLVLKQVRAAISKAKGETT